MSEMLKAGDVVILEEYLSQYAKEIPHAIVSTGNASADASFGYYISLAEKENIKVDHQIIMQRRAASRTRILRCSSGTAWKMQLKHHDLFPRTSA